MKIQKGSCSVLFCSLDPDVRSMQQKNQRLAVQIFFKRHKVVLVLANRRSSGSTMKA